MKPYRNALIVFAAIWLFGCLFEILTYLRWPNPVNWSEVARWIVAGESLAFAALAFLFTKGSGK